MIRDRPRLVASQHVEVTPAPVETERKAQMVLLVVNEGRQPVTVRDAGFGVDFTKHGRWPFRRRGPFGVLRGTQDQVGFPLRLEAGAPLELRLDVKDVTVNPKMVPQGFVEDSRQRVSEAAPFFTAESLEDAQKVGSRTFGWVAPDHPLDEAENGGPKRQGEGNNPAGGVRKR